MDVSAAYLGAWAGTAEGVGTSQPVRFPTAVAPGLALLRSTFGWTSSAGILGLLHVLVFWLPRDIPHWSFAPVLSLQPLLLTNSTHPAHAAHLGNDTLAPPILDVPASLDNIGDLLVIERDGN